MDCKDELIKRPLLPIKNFKDELEQEHEQPLLCTKLYFQMFGFKFLNLIAFVCPTPASAVVALMFLHRSSIIMQKKVLLSIFYLAITIFTMFKQISLTRAQWDRTFKYLIEEGDIKNLAICRCRNEIEITYDPPFKQTRCCVLSCLITWAFSLVFLFLTTNLCDVDDENMKELCTIVDRENFFLSLLLCFLWGILLLMLSSIQLTSRCDEDELELLRNVNTETDELVLCKKRSEVSLCESCSGTDSHRCENFDSPFTSNINKDEIIDSIDVLVFIEKKCNACNARRTKLRKDQQTKDGKEESIDVMESDQTHINGQNEQFEASTQVNKTVEDELRGLQSKYYDLQMKYDSLLHIFDL